MNPTTINPNNLLQQGIEAYQRGERETARALLGHSLQLAPQNEAGWLWLAAVVPDLRDVEICLQNALGLNPRNAETASRLAHVQATLAQIPGYSYAPPVPTPPSNYRPGRGLLDFGATQTTQPNPQPAPRPQPQPTYAAPTPKPPPASYQPAPPAQVQYQTTQPPVYGPPRTARAIRPVQAGPPLLARGIYFALIGWWVTFLWVTIAWLFNVTVVGLPVGLIMLNLVPQVLTLEPTRSEFITTYRQTGRLSVQQLPLAQPPLLVRAIYFVLIGWWASLLVTYLAAFLCATLIGLPLGIWLFHRLPLVTTLKQL